MGRDAPFLMTHRTTCAQRAPLSLRRIFPAASFVGCADIAVIDAFEQSHRCTPGSLFAALPGTKSHGRDFVVDAVRHGAGAILTDRPVVRAEVPQCVVPDVRQAFAELCQALAGNPSRHLGLVGVTGTNGKTTTTWMIRSLLESAGRPAGLLGTIQYSDGIESAPSRLTTPDSRTLASWLSAMVAKKTRYGALELSSHALHQQRAAGIGLDVAIVTNITQDHFDYHGDLANYTCAKARVFDLVKRGGLVVLNNDDPGCRSIWEQAAGRHRTTTVGLDGDADVDARILQQTAASTTFEVTLGARNIVFRTPLIGRHNVSNALCAIVAADHLGVSHDDIQTGLEALTSVPGRLERISCGQPFQVFVDYAHTDDALRRVIRTLREVTPGRILCLFGAGGDRDRGKRPKMGAAAAHADIAIVTSDNPRTEDPDQILADIVRGFSNSPVRPLVVADREEAIERALELAEPGDTVLLAGKGHEKVQIVGEEQIPFDDVAICRSRLRQLVRAPQQSANL